MWSISKLPCNINHCYLKEYRESITAQGRYEFDNYFLHYSLIPSVTIHMTHGLFSFFSPTYSTAPTLTPLWLISLMSMTHCSHTYSTLTHISHAHDSLLPHLLHSDSYLSRLWLITPTLTPPLPRLLHHDSSTPICTFTIYTARHPPVTLAWSYSNIPEF